MPIVNSEALKRLARLFLWLPGCLSARKTMTLSCSLS